jgi:hypothetical protein
MGQSRLVEREFLAPKPNALLIHNKLNPAGLARPKKSKILDATPTFFGRMGWWRNTDRARGFAVVWLGWLACRAFLPKAPVLEPGVVRVVFHFR